MKNTPHPTNDPRVAALGQAGLCGNPPSAGIPVAVRNHVTFEKTAVIPISLDEVVDDFRSFWMPNETRKFRGPHRSWFGQSLWFELSWNAKHYHRVYIAHVDAEKWRACASHSVRKAASWIVSSILNQWLVQSVRFSDQRWYSARDWRGRTNGSASPW
jgi:hypothetical protein